MALASKIPPNRHNHYTPLRYPGGKGKLAAFVENIVAYNDLADGEYAEPYAGGAAIALQLLLHEYVSRIHINDISRPIYSFWEGILDNTDDFCRFVAKTPRTVKNWDKQKKIFKNPNDHDNFTLGCATFFLNRTNRSGILNGGIIGGRDQTGQWKIDARYNPKELVARIEAIAKMRNRINVTKLDAEVFLKRGAKKWPENTLIYCDPPYYEKGRDLYYDFYEPDDHQSIAEIVKTITKQKWIVSYDNVKPIRQLYKNFQSITYDIGYSARKTRKETEVMFFSDTLHVPPLIGPMDKVTDNTFSNGTFKKYTPR